MKQQEQHEITLHETSIINVLNALEPYERITFEQLARYIGIHERRCRDIVEDLRNKDYRIIASRKRSDLGIRYAVTDEEWQEYKRKRNNEIQNRIAALEKLG